MNDESGDVTSEGGESSPTLVSQADERLSDLRANDRQRRVAFAAAIVVGLGLTSLHWAGLFLAGALVGLTRRTLPQAVLSGLGFGVVVLVAFFALTPLVTPSNVGVLAPLSYITIGAALLAPAWGALVRGAL